MNPDRTNKWILLVIVLSQFFCTSLWFAGNAVLSDLINSLYLPQDFLASVTSAVQFGFISGTLLFALLAVADRTSPSFVFFICAIVAALFNLGICIGGITASELLLLRFGTGFFLAGIYPVGMKIAADHYQQGLSKSLGFLVGALVLGTAFPHLLKSMSAALPWSYVIYTISALSVLGGLLVFLLIPDGPYRKKSQRINLFLLRKAFDNQNLRSAAFGYFGHMWELYTFWAFVPLMLSVSKAHHHSELNVPLLSFCIIAIGSLACVVSGLLSQRYGVKKVAGLSLLLSCLCCLLSPVFLWSASVPVLVGFLLLWSIFVIADSPLFSTLVAQNAPEEGRGTSLTIVNCIGFSLTIISIQLMKILTDNMSNQYCYMILAVGPIFGLMALYRNKG